VTSDKEEKLQMALTGIQKRWGSDAISLVRRPTSTVPHISTGFPALDKALNVGGIPRGRVSEIIGVPTSGMATMALKIMSNAQSQKGTAVYIDLERTFDPDYADRCGVSLHRLVLVHPYNFPQALAMVPDFIVNGGMDLLIFDMPLHLQTEPHIMRTLSTILGRLLAPLSRTGCALLFLTTLFPGSSPSLTAYPQQTTLPHYATMRLLIQKERWLYKQRDVSGYEAQVLIAKNKLGLAGKKARIAITFDGTVARDGT
jgi:recombination protein RecA